MVGSTLAFGQEEIQQAIACLPKRQREALELLELEQLSYEDIAAQMGTSGGSVPQLIARARINLYDELRGTPLASIAAPSPECERSLPLIAARDDGELDHADGDAAWLDVHLAGCDRCRPAVGQMTEVAASYRAWAAQGASDSAAPAPLGPGEGRPRWRSVALVATSLAVVLFAGLVAALVGGGGAPAPEATEVAAPGTGGSQGAPAKPSDADSRNANAGKKKFKPAKQKVRTAAGQGAAGEPTAGEPAPTTVIDPAPSTAGGAPSEHTSGPTRASSKTGVNPPKQVSTQKPNSKPKPAPSSTPASQLAPEQSEAPSSEASTPIEEGPEKPGRSGEAPGKPADRPPR